MAAKRKRAVSAENLGLDLGAGGAAATGAGDANPQVPERKIEFSSRIKERHPMRLQIEMLNQIVRTMKAGHMRLPLFQRPFVWTDAQIFELLESLVCGYPIGQILLWERMKISSQAPPLVGVPADADPGAPYYLVLDGQQRLSAMAQAFIFPGWGYDLEAEKVVKTTEESPSIIPLPLITGQLGEQTYTGWMRKHYPSVENVFLHRSFQIIDRIRYQCISMLTIPGSWDLSSAVEVFRRLNTTGSPMSAEHLAQGLANVATLEEI